MTGLRSGQVAAAGGIIPQTLRYYRRPGLLAEPDRSLFIAVSNDGQTANSGAHGRT